MPSKLPPLPESDNEIFDGEKQKYDIPKVLPRCKHNKAEFKNGELRCPCGSAWAGPNLQELYKAFRG